MSKTRGLYEILVTEGVALDLADLDETLQVHRGPLHAAEAPDRFALHLSRVLKAAISTLGAEDRVAVAAKLARALVDQINEAIPKAEVGDEKVQDPTKILRSILSRLPDGSTEKIELPGIPLFDTTLLTNSPGEPRVGSQILSEIHSADRIDLVMAFIRRTGISPMLEALRTHCENGRPLRVLTTTYTGSTEAAALDALCSIGAEVRVSYDTSTTRLHAKAWLFHRRSGFSTAFIGSSNLTHSAQVTGLEWNVRVSGARNGDVVDKVAAVFESYWNSGDFVPYDREEFARRTELPPDSGPQIFLSPIEVEAQPFQERLLEQIALSRLAGFHRNLLVSATGTGKTVMAAIDYARLREELPRGRLLFVAHREEILVQSQATFRHCLRDHAFGEQWVNSKRPQRFEHVFASIQSLNSAGLADLAPDHFDVVIIDEFHHAAANSYQALLNHLKPIELLGLTATPERSDGLPLLEIFGNRIAAELRLWDAIDQHRLCPFTYYGIHDGLDLRDIPWSRGRGYDTAELSNLYCATDAWAKQVIVQLVKRVDDVRTMRCLGFCVSVEHAQYMARIFREAGIAATAVWGDSPTEDRKQALVDLSARRINVVFSVDLFNEGVDVPLVDTLLLLRPTESPTLFLQQLGRGLRRAAKKSVCTVLDFVGTHRTEFRFDRRFQALLGGSRRELIEKIEHGFPFLPAGCHMELDAVASQIVLKSIRESLPTRWPAKVEELRRLSLQNADVSLSSYLEETGIELSDVYSGSKSWSDMRQDAGLAIDLIGSQEKTLRRACSRLLHIDDPERIRTFRTFLAAESAPSAEKMDSRGRRWARMLVSQVLDQAVTKATSLAEGCILLWQHPQVRREVIELLDVLEAQISHVHRPLPGQPDVPLQVHARYTRLEILAALGVGEGAKVAPWQTGVYWAEKAKTDLLAFTLDKTDGHFSPTTRYRDYAISRDLIHWESQGVTRADSATGTRYQNHVALGTTILLFARLKTDDRAFWCLGPATYVRHESERPMAITWRLQFLLPGDLFATFAAAIA